MNISEFKSLTRISGPILLTGHTGFKGSWLTLLLEELGVEVFGYSLEPEKDSLYSALDRRGKIREVFADIRDQSKLHNFINELKPVGVIHLAAQALVLESYRSPKETFDVNVMGTANLLGILAKQESIRKIVVSTTDKVYKNENTGRRFRESDPLEGVDPYSASKVATESVIHAWQNIFNVNEGPTLIAVRAGNVIGGGDLSKDRLLPDCVRASISGDTLEVRNADSVRPWQHVLEPLIGYIYALNSGNQEAYNFGPFGKQEMTVIEVVQRMSEHLKFNFKVQNTPQAEYESKLLALDSSLASTNLGWHPIFSQKTAVDMTASWWTEMLEFNNAFDVTQKQIKDALTCITTNGVSI